MASSVDTLAFIRRPRKSSFPADRSDAPVEAVNEAVRGSVATKSDLDPVKADLDLSMEKVRAGMAVMRRMLTIPSGGVVALVLKGFL